MLHDVEFKGFYNFENHPAWVYGDLIQSGSSKKIHNRESGKSFGVEEELIGQLVGLDKNNNKIFSNVDIVEFIDLGNPDLSCNRQIKRIAIFVFNELSLKYELKINDRSVYTGKKPYFMEFDKDCFANFKVIGDVVYNKDLIGE